MAIQSYEDVLNYGTSTIPAHNNRTESFVYSASEVMKKNTVEMIYSNDTDSISPFDILLDLPDSDFTRNSLTERKGVMIMVIFVPAHSNIDYHSTDDNITIVCDVAECSQKEFKGKQFYFPTTYNPHDQPVNKLSKELCDSACFSGISVFNNGKVCCCAVDYDGDRSFRILCQIYQVY